MPEQQQIAYIFELVGRCLAHCHIIESNIYHHSVIISVADDSARKCGENDTDFNSRIAKKQKKKSHHDRINELGEKAPQLWASSDIDLLHEARSMRNEIAHVYISEHTELFFDAEAVLDMIIELHDKRDFLIKVCDKVNDVINGFKEEVDKI